MLKGRLKLPRVKFPRASTLMLVPHSQQSIYSIRIPFALIIMLIFLIICTTILVVYSSSRYLNMQENMTELEALRSVNKQQDVQLELMEAEVQMLQGKMLHLEYLEQDVREMLDSGVLAGQPATPGRVSTQASRGGGRDFELSGRLNIANGGFFAERESFRERQSKWEQRYNGAKNTTGALLAKVDAVGEEMAVLKKDVANKKEYLESRPTGRPVAGRISSGFGPRKAPFSGYFEFHPGVDIAANYGTPVAATAKGVVVFAGYRSGYGKTVLVRHKFGFQTMYCHNSSIKVKSGQEVTRGQVIARVGSSGISTGPHLHYEVHLNGARVNPSRYL